MVCAGSLVGYAVVSLGLLLTGVCRIPENVRFVQSDFESEWALGKDSFDLIHLRTGVGSVSSWPSLFRRVFGYVLRTQDLPFVIVLIHACPLSHLKSGFGWFEFVDFDLELFSDDGSLSQKSALVQWQNILFDATSSTGKSFRYPKRIREMLQEAKFIDIQQVTLRVPINTWPTDPYMKDCGRWFGLGLIEGLEGLSLGPFTRVLGWNEMDVKNYLGAVKKDIQNKNIRAYCNVLVPLPND